MFFADRFGGLTVLRVDLGMSFAMARRVCGKIEDEGEWWLPVVRNVDGERVAKKVGVVAPSSKGCCLLVYLAYEKIMSL
jgi:hypothetical protein